MRAVMPLRRFMRLPLRRKVLLLEAVCQLALAWFLVRCVPFRFWSPLLGQQAPGEVVPREGTGDPRAPEICGTITSINRRLKGRLTCLMLAMAAQWMMCRRRISCSLVLGTLMERDEQQQSVFKAHAWLRDVNGVVLGGQEHPFVPISSFVYRYPPACPSSVPK